ncbi:hypothetical protein GUJ93_ZPchr0010g7628 [Zizania palustris]|uniref:1-phosphatidylinositol-4-phosphate 5-kinase n=1 Tax=Zizania palustris TaxID=103762 RepID=A0A8J5W910_ZIZPA|nr:hypothetical protein GUJ93_ZPchr0010g7628 [Zizania palustris]
MARRRGARRSGAVLCAAPRICIWECDGEAGDITCGIIAAPLRRSYSAKAMPPPPHFRMMTPPPLRPQRGDVEESRSPRRPSARDTGAKEATDVIIAMLLLSDARELRKMFGVDPAEYMLAICGNDTLRELASPGKSESCFFITQDDQFMIKTVKKSEVKVRFIIMGKFCRSEYKIHRRFDLKGSSHGRTIDITEQKIDETTALKDLDLQYAFLLQRFWYEELMNLMDHGFD